MSITCSSVSLAREDRVLLALLIAWWLVYCVSVFLIPLVGEFPSFLLTCLSIRPSSSQWEGVRQLPTMGRGCCAEKCQKEGEHGVGVRPERRLKCAQLERMKWMTCPDTWGQTGALQPAGMPSGRRGTRAWLGGLLLSTPRTACANPWL